MKEWAIIAHSRSTTLMLQAYTALLASLSQQSTRFCVLCVVLQIRNFSIIAHTDHGKRVGIVFVAIYKVMCVADQELQHHSPY